MRLRARYGNETVMIGQSLTLQSTLSELKSDLAKALPSLDSSDLVKIKMGFPPKFVTNQEADSLAQCGVKDGDQLLVEVEKSAAVGGGERAETASSKTTGQDDAKSFSFGTGRVTQQSTVAPPIASSTTSDTNANVRPAQPPSTTDEIVPVSEGFLLVRKMKDDNSCLFHSLSYLLAKNSTPSSLRKIISTTILSHPHLYTTPLLGRPPAEYATWIESANSWGGAIELSIFAAHFETEIVSVDVSNLRVDRFGEGSGYTRVAILFYSGIHYDAVAVNPVGPEPGVEAFDETVFSGEAKMKEVVEAAVELAKVWKSKRKFTDLGKFTLKCSVCKEGLVGQKEAQRHAMELGHASFEEY
ncbi:ubiquitin-specific protease otu1 [Podochytrium sp. JEL0797]|nr:ubiquitin-specific protease otu1 [Podochytrium sp. JEL0797]